MTKYKTVKRKAEVGERILITDGSYEKEWASYDQKQPRYNEGDVLTVSKLGWGDRGLVEFVLTAENSEGSLVNVNHEEYEVIIENEMEAGGMGIIEQMQAEIAELKTKMSAMEEWHTNGKLPKTMLEVAGKHCDKLIEVAIDNARQYNKQSDRDEIVERAKRDVADRFFLDVDGYNQVIDGHSGHNQVEFIVNHEKRTVVALLRLAYVPQVISAKGIAKCAPNDCFNSHIGKAIAVRRALGLEVPAEYLNAPQPAEVRVGDVVETYLGIGEHHATFEVTGYWEGDRNKLTGKGLGYTSFEPEVGDKVIDDSREKVSE
ncbi:hypothetical protein [Heyndrickxia oleronia]|uniref:Uncharacterized protein n=1 Tax=Heyndrickxia oleronia TaxID=38875 RepID=A0AAW6SRI6_9BACI|nr:hypothetical protein [Heyndrickxia oleronia]MDH5159878.1 hypothetical protein [Heyndrickxia oleronia]